RRRRNRATPARLSSVSSTRFNGVQRGRVRSQPTGRLSFWRDSNRAHQNALDNRRSAKNLRDNANVVFAVAVAAPSTATPTDNYNQNNTNNNNNNYNNNNDNDNNNNNTINNNNNNNNNNN
uniref:putative uncharacterized protein DDB_G0283051 n=1 Tax=Bombus vancouverensis nearcticus TaxID=2705178 RepID=UPI00143ACBCC